MSRSMPYCCLMLLGAVAALSGCAADAPEGDEAQSQSDAIVSSITEGDFVIHSVANNKCVDISAGNKDDGGKVQLWDCNGSTAQKFHLSPTSDGYWKIINVNSGKGLDIAGASTAENAVVQQWTYLGGNNQQFKFVSRGNSQFSLQVRHNDMAIDLYWGKADNGTGFVQYPYTGTSNQLYTIEAAGGSTGGTGGTPSSGTGCLNIGDNTTTLRFVNRCGFRVNFAGSDIAGGGLGTGEESCRNIGSNTDHLISKRYWGFRDGNDPGNEHRSLAEFGFNENFAGHPSWDWFNLSHVDANNLPLKIIPYEVGGGTTCVNQTRSCPMDMLQSCPDVGKQRNGAGEIIACVSHDRDNPNSPVAKYFDQKCGQAYSWSGDDGGQSMAACNAGDFDIVFCPPN